MTLQKINRVLSAKISATSAGGCRCSGATQICDTFSPKNLFRFLKKKLRSYDEITAFLKNLPEEERYIGCLPKKWIKLFDKSKINEKTKIIQKVLSDFAKSEYSPHSFNPKINPAKIKKLSNDLTKILGRKCDVSFLGSGLSGKAFRIKCAGEDVVLKIFNSDTPSYLLNLTGKTKEIANAVALNYTLKPSQRTHFYFGKVAIDKEPDGFMVTEFVDKNSKNLGIKKFFKKLYKRFILQDSITDGNIIDGKIVDFGFIKYNFASFEQQMLAKKLCSFIKKHDLKGIERMKEIYGKNIFFKDLLKIYKTDLEKLAVI